MSRGNILQGQASGKLGDTVLMVRNGQQLARVYTTSGARSGEQASEAARIQRVKFGAASNQWELYRYVCTRMYRKGRKPTQSDYNYFVKKNAGLLPYLTKTENAQGIHCLQPGVFSEGGLGRIELLYSFNSSPGTAQPAMVVSDTQSSSSSAVGWDATMAVFKSALAARYPHAAKVTYLFSVATDVSIEEEGVEYISQNIVHHPVVINLFESKTPGENTLTVAHFFRNSVSDSMLAAVFGNQTGYVLYNNKVISLGSENVQTRTFIGSVGCMLFASDDNVSDAYTTILPESAVNPIDGVYNLWSTYRTDNALRVAASSYGYQSGVMRDYVASSGGDLTAAANAYAARLSTIDAEAAKAFSEKITAEGGATARTIRKPIAPVEE